MTKKVSVFKGMQVTVLGVGKPILLLHDVGFSADVWLQNGHLIADNNILVCPELWGHGRSREMPRELTSIKDICAHFLDLMLEQGFYDFTVVAQGSMAIVGTELAVLAPQRVKAVSIVNTPMNHQCIRNMKNTPRRESKWCVRTKSRRNGQSEARLDDPSNRTELERLSSLLKAYRGAELWIDDEGRSAEKAAIASGREGLADILRWRIIHLPTYELDDQGHFPPSCINMVSSTHHDVLARGNSEPALHRWWRSEGEKL